MVGARSQCLNKSRNLGGVLLAIGFVCGIGLHSSNASAQTFTQPEVSLAINQSLDIMKEHVRFLALQDQYDSALAYYSLTYRVAPARVAVHDGRTPRTAFQRLGQSIGVGFGSPKEFTMFGGAWIDIAGASVPGTEVNGLGANGLLFLGVGARGFQFTYGSFLKSTDLKKDIFGNYPANERAINQLPGGEGKSEAFTLYHSTGASLILVRTMGDNGWELSNVRAQLQPLHRYLPSEFGLPMIALQRLSQNQSYFGDLSNSLLNQQPSADLSGSASQNAPYEVELGSDDLLESGIRAHVLTRVAPELKFRKAELGWYHDVGPLTFAGLFSSYMRNEAVQVSGNAFARIAFGDPKPHKIGWPVSLGVSYSYNSPDTLTFIPLPYTHVFGFQFTVGVPEIGKALVPIVRATNGAKK